jgi:hypothetical protein
MLSDAQIDRYCRQIVLPEVGSSGQQRLLDSSVSILGGGDGALVCASYLAGAGVGMLRPSGPDGSEAAAARAFGGLHAPESFAEILRERNPDCRVEFGGRGASSLTVAIGSALPDRLDGPLVWGGAGRGHAAAAHLPAGSLCPECLRAFVVAERRSESSAVVGTLVALLALRALLGLAGRGATVVRLDLRRGSAATSSPSPRAGCPTCSAHA